jgi:hypothetical protein
MDQGSRVFGRGQRALRRVAQLFASKHGDPLSSVRHGAHHHRGKTIISGTGRAGTTLLMRIFIRLALPTGFTTADSALAEAQIGRAGLEHTLTAEKAKYFPELFKSPYLCDCLDQVIQENWMLIDQIIVPVRNLDHAAASRVNISQKAKDLGQDPYSAPGGLWDTTQPLEQKRVIAEKLYQLIDSATRNQIPLLMLSFPRFALDVDYFAQVLGPFLQTRFNVSDAALRRAHAQEVNANFITEFAS